jgi:hypothetical protein
MVIRCLCTFTLILTLCSCVYTTPASVKEDAIRAADIKPGITTREDVLLKVGCGFKMSDDEKIFTTEITRSGRWGFTYPLAFPPYSNYYEHSTNPINYVIEIEFNDREIVERYETFKMPDRISVEKLTSRGK